MNVKGHILFVILIIISALIGAKALFHPGLYTAHDIWHQVARIYHYSKSLSEGQFLPTWISQLANGFGYPLFMFSYHLPWLIGAPLVLAGVSIPVAIKSLFLICLIGSGLSMYVLSLAITKQRLASFLSAFIYMWAPYQFLTIFVSAAIGTAFQFVIAPLLLLGLYWTVTNRPRAGIILTSISVCLSILSHLMTFVYIGVFSFAFAGLLAFLTKPKFFFKKVLLMTIGITLGLCLSGPYLFPLIQYNSLIIAGNEGSGFSNLVNSNFIDFKQLVYSKWGYGPIVSNAKDGEISFQMGIAQWISVAVSTFIIIIAVINKQFRKKVGNKFPLFLLIFCFLITSILGMMDISKPIWKIVTSFISLDYPFRLLLLAVLFSSLLASLVLSVMKIRWLKLALALLVITSAIYTNRNHIRVNQYTDIPISLYVQSETTTNTFHEYLPKGADGQLIHGDPPPLIAIPEGLEPLNVNLNTISTEFEINLSRNTDLTLNEFSFVGQHVYVNNQLVNHQTDGRGRIVFAAPEGASKITRRFEQTSAQQAGFITAIFAMLICLKIAIPKGKSR